MLKLEHEMSEANSDRDVAKTELNMRTIEKIELEERIRTLQKEHADFREKAMD